MSNISIEILDRPPSIDDETLDLYISRLRPMRLKSLKQHPNSFISKYESEVQEPHEFWAGRQREKSATHIVALRGDSQTDENSSMRLRNQEWVAFLVLIAPESDQTEAIARESSEKTTLASSMKEGEYFMAALYVDSSLQGQGVATSLIHTMFDVIKDKKRKNLQQTTICTTSVRHGNDNALRLYQKLGFVVEDEDRVEEKEGVQYHVTFMRIKL